jgi:hypothetical protein
MYRVNFKLFIFIKIRALQQNEPIQPIYNRGMQNTGDYGEDMSSLDANKNESLNNLVGGTTNLLELKLGGRISGSARGLGVTESPRLNTSFHSHGTFETSQIPATFTSENADLQVIDLTKDRKDLDVEFEQVIHF